MRQRSFRVLVSLCFLLLLLGVGAQGQGYKRPKPPVNDPTPPTNADLAVQNGVSESITVLMLNLTPYDIEFHSWSITPHNEYAMTQDSSNYNLDEFMFVPVGIPSLIPGLPEEDFNNPDPNYVDTKAHPYPVVFAFNDQPHSPSDPPANLDNWVNFTVKGVQYRPCDLSGLICQDQPVSQDVQVGLWMYRNSTTAVQTAYWLEPLAAALKLTFTSVCLIAEGGANPAAWIHEFLALGELGKALTPEEWSKDTENTRENDGRKMWVASYVIPHQNSLCVQKSEGCVPSTFTPATSGDAVYSLWPARYAGPSPDGLHGPSSAAEENLVVEVGLLRGLAAKQCGGSDKVCSLGREPVVTITVVRAQDFAVGAMAGLPPKPSLSGEVPGDKIRLFLLQAGAGTIRELLEKRGRPGLLVLRSVIQGLAPAQQTVLSEMLRTMGSGRLPTQQERRLVHLMADELKARLLHPQSH